ncbi:hypothetical protein [Sinomonas gamaensis]|uniref:hypothetical protein n=1 Tax=Sinomonas gamaensis TaxID=2565624 RepID=UPI001487071C|nr:hypothetical protein [Sinomonas gamaensis]
MRGRVAAGEGRRRRYRPPSSAHPAEVTAQAVGPLTPAAAHAVLNRTGATLRSFPYSPQRRSAMVNGDRRNAIHRPNREDLSQDFAEGPEEKAWDEEDGLFDSEEIVIS